MKFLIVTGIYPPEIGGPATVMELLARDLRALNHEVVVVTYGDVPTNGVIRVSRSGSVPERYLRMSSVIRRELEKMGPQAVLLATDVFSVGIPARIALSGRSNRFAVRLGGEWAWEDAVTKRGLRVTLREYWENHAHGFSHFCKTSIARLVLRRANQIILTSDLLFDVLQRIDQTFPAKTKTVPNIPTRDSCVPAPAVQYPALRVLYSGRFAPVKNLPFFARALKKALEQGAQISMVFVGDGEERAECERILDGETHVRFMGRLPPNEVVNLLSEADLYVMPSLSDICPNGVLEAIGCGVPSLLTSEHGLPKDMGGLMEVNPKDENAWVQALVKLAAADREAITKLRLKVRLPRPSSISLVDVCLSYGESH